MATPDVFWPYFVLPPRKVTPEVVPATTSGGRSITATEQIISFDAGYWQIALDEIPYASRANKILWRALAAKLDGRFGTCSVPIYDTDGTPWPLRKGKPVKSYRTVPFSDTMLFSDGTGFVSTVIRASFNAAASQGDTQVSLALVNADQLQPGQHFSAANRLYRVKNVISTTGGFLTDDSDNPILDDNGNPLMTDFVGYVVTVNVPLREAISIGDPAEFDDPRCICRLVSDLEMMSAADDYAGRSLAKVTFVEAINL